MGRTVRIVFPFILFLIKKTIQQISDLNIITQTQELTLSDAPSGESPFTRMSFFSESRKIAAISYMPKYNLQIYDYINGLYELTEEQIEDNKQIRSLYPIEKTSYMIMSQYIKYFFTYDSNSLSTSGKKMEIVSTERIYYSGPGHIEDTNLIFHRTVISDTTYYWKIYDYTKPAGAITPEQSYNSPDTSEKVYWLTHIKKTQIFFVSLIYSTTSNRRVTQDYVTKEIKIQFDEFSLSRLIGSISYLNNTNYILLSEYWGGISMYDYTGDSGTAPVKELNYLGYAHSEVYEIKGKNLLITGDSNRNNYFFIDTENNFEFINHNIYRKAPNLMAYVIPSYDGEIFISPSVDYAPIFKVKIFFLIFLV